MNYLIIFNDVNGAFDKKDIHKRITEQLDASNWWHYLANAYIITTSVSSAGITNSLSGWFPGLLFLIIKVDLEDASGVLPKEAFDWIRDKSGKYVKVSRTTMPGIKISPSRAGGASGSAGVLLRSLGLGPVPPKSTRLPQTIAELLKR